MKNFALIGAGYIAEAHLKAIKNTGNNLVAFVDPHDSVGKVDKYFLDAQYFKSITELETLKTPIDYYVICTPNNLHLDHIKALRGLNASIICEKPLVLNMDELNELSGSGNGDVKCVLQLRHHETAKVLKDLYGDYKGRKLMNVTYVTRRGNWYQKSWKGDWAKSGGILMNIGIHLFDLLIWLFGKVRESEVCFMNSYRAFGSVGFDQADVSWTLSLDEADLPSGSMHPFQRSIAIDNKEYDLSNGFHNLHTKVYDEILSGGGPGIEECRPSLELVEKLKEQ